MDNRTAETEVAVSNEEWLNQRLANARLHNSELEVKIARLCRLLTEAIIILDEKPKLNVSLRRDIRDALGH